MASKYVCKVCWESITSWHGPSGWAHRTNYKMAHKHPAVPMLRSEFDALMRDVMTQVSKGRGTTSPPPETGDPQ